MEHDLGHPLNFWHSISLEQVKLGTQYSNLVHNIDCNKYQGMMNSN